MSRTESGFRHRLLAGPVMRNAVRVSLVIGTVLNTINQGSTIWLENHVDWPRLLLNYAIPFAVASYSAAKVGSPPQ